MFKNIFTGERKGTARSRGGGQEATEAELRSGEEGRRECHVGLRTRRNTRRHRPRTPPKTSRVTRTDTRGEQIFLLVDKIFSMSKWYSGVLCGGELLSIFALFDGVINEPFTEITSVQLWPGWEARARVAASGGGGGSGGGVVAGACSHTRGGGGGAGAGSWPGPGHRTECEDCHARRHVPARRAPARPATRPPLRPAQHSRAGAVVIALSSHLE